MVMHMFWPLLCVIALIVGCSHISEIHVGAQYEASIDELMSKRQQCYDSSHDPANKTKLAFKFCKQAAEAGDIQSQVDVGVMYMLGEGVSQNSAQALEFFIKAAKSGSAVAKNNIGVLYYQGIDGLSDYDKALYWYKLASKEGVELADYNIGVMYLRGHGVPKNYTLAAKFFLRAAQRGVLNAQNNIGLMYAKGLGVQRDDIKAYAWLNLAAVHGDDDSATMRDIVAKQMSSYEIKCAQSIASKFWSEIE